jgi:TPR repeat protein
VIGSLLAVITTFVAPARASDDYVLTAPQPSELVARAIAREHGEGVAKDHAEAATLYCMAAREGDVEGLFGLAWMYANGRGMPRDSGIAGALFAKAAEGGHEPSVRMLALIGDRAALPECLTIEPVVIVEAPAPSASAEPVEPAPRTDPFATLPASKRKIVEMVKNVAPKFAVEPDLALAVIAAESNFETTARSPKHAVGLMQLIPDTAARFNVRNLLDPLDNVRGGLKYLRWLLAYYQGSVALVAAAYNAGEGVVDRYGGIPPFRETRDYVERVMQVFQSAWHPYDPTIAGPSKALLARGAAPEATKRIAGQLPAVASPTVRAR